MAATQETTSAIRLILRYLEQEGVEYLFGIPGGPIIPLYEAMHGRQVIKPILTKHEGGAVFMADAYARVSGKIGVCCTTIGPGATNAVTGMAVAYADRIPVLLLTPQTPTSQFGRGAFQDSSPEGVDIVSLFKPVSKWSAMVPHPDRAAATLRTALRVMTSGRPGPVHLNLPCDFVARSVAEELLPVRQFRCPARTFDRTAVREAALALLNARQPVILAGHGVNLARAWAPLRELARRFEVPVATTFKAKGAFPEDDALSLGVLSNSCEPRTLEYVADPRTDVLLAVGTSLGEVSSAGWEPRLAQKALLQIDIDPVEIGRNYPVSTALVGDAATVLTELRFAMEREFQKAPPDSFPRRAAPSFRLPAGALDEPQARGPLKPQQLLRELRCALPRDAILFVENGTMRTWAGRYFPVYQEGCFFVNMGMASMGYATAGCIGGQLAAPGRAVVAVVGDAAFAMNGMEVHTAVEHHVPVIWVVANNGGHGMVYHGENRLFQGRFHTGLFRQRIDAAGLAGAMGCASCHVRQPGELAEAVGAALRRRGPSVIDVACDLDEAPPSNLRDEALRRQLVAA